MKKGIKIVWGIIEVLIIIYVIMMTTCILSRNKYGYTQIRNYHIIPVTYNLKDASDELVKNNLLIVKNTKNIKKGDFIYYYSLYKKDYIVRAAKISDIRVEKNKKKVFLDDGIESSIERERVLGKNSIHIKRLGGVLSYLETKNGFILGVLLPVIIIFIYQAIAFFLTVRKAVKDKTPEEIKQEEIDELFKEKEEIKVADTVVDDILLGENKEIQKENPNNTETIENPIDTAVDNIKDKDKITQILEEKKNEEEVL